MNEIQAIRLNELRRQRKQIIEANRSIQVSFARIAKLRQQLSKKN